jgi:phage repressor protein C with HTH and peptisase S24 domain
MGENFSLPTSRSIVPFSERPFDDRKLRLLPINGSSMEPTLRPGDFVVCDTSQSEVTVDRIYVLEINGCPTVMRCQLWPGHRVRTWSDHPALRGHPVFLPREEVIVLGAVVMHCRPI